MGRFTLALGALLATAACGTAGPDPLFGEGADLFNGVYTGTATATSNTCGFDATSPARGQLRVLPSGTGTWASAHTGSAVSFEFPVRVTVIGDEARFTVTGTAIIGGLPFTVEQSAVLSGGTASIRETVGRFESGSLSPACTSIFDLRLTR